MNDLAPSSTSAPIVAISLVKPAILPPVVMSSLDGIAPWHNQKAYLIPRGMIDPLLKVLQPGLDAIDGMFAPTDIEQVLEFLSTFATRRGFKLPEPRQLAMDALAISKAIPADLFSLACRRLWETFAYRRLAETADFTRAIETELRSRKNAAAALRGMKKQLEGMNTPWMTACAT
jgi:hypothetical protein